MSGGGKGNSSQSTQQTASNQQVGASQGSAAIGAGSSGNTVNITTSDVQGLQDLIAGNSYVTSAALDSNTAVAQGAIAGNTGLAGLAIESQANLAGRSIDSINQSNANSENIVSAATEQALQATNGSLSQANNLAASLASMFTSFESANSPGSAALAVQQTGAKTQYNIVLLGGLALVIFYLMTKSK
jgi:hypothetical protein